MDVGGGDVTGDRQPQGVDQQMPLPAFHAFMRVVAADAGRFLNGLHALAVYDGAAWVGIATDVLALSTM
jgi:hypothetical protein